MILQALLQVLMDLLFWTAIITAGVTGAILALVVLTIIGDLLSSGARRPSAGPPPSRPAVGTSDFSPARASGQRHSAPTYPRGMTTCGAARLPEPDVVMRRVLAKIEQQRSWRR